MNRNISEDVKSKLQALASQQVVQANFDRVAKCVFMNLAGDTNNTAIVDQLAASEPSAYELFNLLLLFTVECLKQSLVAFEISTLIADMGYDQTLAEAYTKKFGQFVTFMQDPENVAITANFDSRIPFKQLVDLDWTQEIVVSSKYANKVYQEIYKVSLHMKDQQAKDSSILFKCTLPQLIEINNKLGVIVKNVDACSDLKHLKQ